MKITFELVSELAHVGWGLGLTLALYLTPLGWWSPLVVTGLSLYKEYVWDKQHEDLVTQGSALEDFLAFYVGINLAIIFMLLGRCS